jgi:hypothetical protein
MSQQTNLNVAPYFDDFNPDNDYYRVLFKPGYPVQARELSTLQSILQNQIEKFGQHFFKEGAKVIPGNTGYNVLYYAVQIETNYLGVPVSAYVDQLVGTKITGKTSGVTAVVDKVLFPQDSERGTLTLYVNYISSNTQNNSTKQFSDGELLTTTVTISSGLLGNKIIASGEPFAITIANNAATNGSSFNISDGVYFVRGQFVNVNTETLILDQYTNSPSYRVGLYIDEQIVTSDIDETLNDNSQGYNNYAAPGADRLKISVFLFKKSLTDFDDNNFVELATIENGILRSKSPTTDYSLVRDELARRTYAESGDYIVSPFDISVKESLNNNQGNKGIFNKGQFTYGGAIANDNLAIYQVSPGKAFVRGYEVETISPSFLNAEKPRTTKTLENQSIVYNTGPTLKLNRVYGAPRVGLGNTFTLSLRDERVGVNTITAPGKEIGLARVYDFKLESGSYNASNSNLNEWHVSLFDIQSFTNITLNVPITLTTPTFVKGNSSGATAFLKNSVASGKSLTLYDVKGSFLPNESFSFDGIQSGFIGVAVTSYGIGDVKSVYGLVSTGSTFTADVIQTPSFVVGIATISESSAGVSTVRSTNPLFPGNIVKSGDLVQYSDLNTSIDPIIAKVIKVSSNEISISGVANINGIANGTLPTSTLSVSDFKVITTKLESSIDNTLYTPLPKLNISNVDLSNSVLSIRKNFIVNISNNKLSTTVVSDTNETFLPFDVERYSLIRSDGKIETLTSDKFEFINGGTQLQIYNLGSNDINATLTATLRKIKPKVKIKRKNRVNSIVISNSKYEGSGIGGTTFNDGLVYGKYPYGTRVQDETISLNTPDVIQIYGVYESADTTEPSAPKAVLASITSQSSTTSELIVGEEIVGSTSGSLAIVAEKLTSSQISLIYKNQNTFKEGEILTFSESNIQAQIVTLDSPSFDISFNYSFNNGQNGSFYDYATIKRKSGSSAPSKKIKVYFCNGYYESTDDGDITTVNSYSTFNYAQEISFINGIRVSDILDIRPRVSNYSITEGSHSPLEFNGRTFSSTNNSSTNVLASDESILTTFSFYMGRIDRIYLTKEGRFQVKYGTPSEKPEKPVSVDDALEIATVTLPPYLYDASQASIQSLEHKRYRMVDIKQLENRIKNLEYYTSLSMLETNTANLFVADSDGLNRFKSGFFVDNFSSGLAQEDKLQIKNSIDPQTKELRPSHYTTSVDLIAGPVASQTSTRDLSFDPIEGINVKKTGDIITLDYAEVEWLKQTFATRTENVAPFIVSFWQGTIELYPTSDTWIDTVRLDAKTISVEGNYAQTTSLLNVDPQTGFSPTVWNAWSTNWTGQEIVTTTKTREENTGYGNYNYWGWYGYGWGHGYYGYYGWYGYYGYYGTFTTVYKDTYQEVISTGVESRDGVKSLVTEQFDTSSAGDKVVSRNVISYMRSRNIEFVSKRLKPSTQIYAFFDGIDVTKYCVPKLLEINMLSGTFQVGETVIGYVQKTGLGQGVEDTSAKITFRILQVNHKEGPYDSPTTEFTQNPYNLQILPSSYSSTSTILNVDTFSLSNSVQGEFGGWVESGMILVGNTSNAQALISNVRLITDISATLIGSFYIPNPNISINPRFESGTKTFTLVDSNINDKNSATTVAEENFSSEGTLETIQEEIISVRNARIENKQVIEQREVSSTTGSELVSTTAGATYINYWWGGKACWYDPLAQSFLIDVEGGLFLTRCDIFFKSKDDMDIPVTIQIRTMQGGLPTQNVVPFSEVVLNPEKISTSQDGSVATPFQFKSPVYLEGGKEYCICLISNSTKYNVFISRVGENDLITQAFISNQPYLGSLFKSQNASTWEPSQWEDLKFTLYRADFIKDGSVEFYNPDLTEGNDQISKLLPNSLLFNSRKVRVSLASTINDSGLVVGNTIIQDNTSGRGNYVGSAGIATGSLTISNAGIGYTPNSGAYVFNNVSLKTITGKGTGAIANITITDGGTTSATILNGGSGYQVGDVLGITTIGNFPVGRDAKLTVGSISNVNQLIIDNVQGEFETGASKNLKYINSLGITTTLNASFGGNILINQIIVENDGLHIRVNHMNHGMYSNNNYVTLSNIESDIKPTKLTTGYASDSTGQISVDDAADFSTFEGVGVGTTNPGYLLIGNEIIEYTSISGNIIGGNIERGNNPVTHLAGSPVYKYEINGISLRRINNTHNLNNVTIDNPVDLDFYQIKLDMSSNGIDRTTGVGYSNLYQNEAKSSGGFNIRATQNIPYEIITPMVQNLTVQGTSLNAEIRTVTNTSVSGNEIPFIDNGFEPVSLNQSNYLASPRLICSKVNEINNLANISSNKSLNMKLTLGTTNTYLSPVIDTQRISAIFTSNRINSVIENYSEDNRVNSIFDDPTAFQYISKEINLESPATSIKILLNGYLNLYSNIRAFYAVGNERGFVPIFTPFPGYDNLNNKSELISLDKSSGLPDSFITPSSALGFSAQTLDYREYTFSADNLPPFKSYRIKLIGTSTNQVYVPRIRDLRVIALA